MNTEKNISKEEESIKTAFREWEDAKNFFEYVNEPELVDYAVYSLEAAKQRFLYLLRQMRTQN